jgi:hypothetical protein
VTYVVKGLGYADSVADFPQLGQKASPGRSATPQWAQTGLTAFPQLVQ